MGYVKSLYSLCLVEYRCSSIKERSKLGLDFEGKGFCLFGSAPLAPHPFPLRQNPAPSILAGISLASRQFWRESGGGGWATAVVLLLLVAWQLLRAFSRRRSHTLADPNPERAPATSMLGRNPSSGISKIISDTDLRELINDFEGNLNERERWEEVVDKKNGQLSYKAKCCRPKVGPLKYMSVTIFEKCSTELLRDFYMDNEYRKEWDKTFVQHEQLQVDETSGTEIGRTIKKFPLLSPREYILAWRVWEGKDKTFYCFIKDCEHPRASRQKKYVRVGFFRSGWCIRKISGRDACEIAMVHQEDAGLNVEMAKLAFSKGIWSYVCKMNTALREYSSRSRSRSQSTSVVTMLRLIQKLPRALETDARTTHAGPSEISGGRQVIGDMTEMKLVRKPSKKWIANGLLLLGGIVCLSRGRSTLGTQIAVACILKKLMKQEPELGHGEPPHGVKRVRRETGRNY